MYIRVGEHHLYTEEETEQLFKPTKTVIHAGFDTDTIGELKVSHVDSKVNV